MVPGTIYSCLGREADAREAEHALGRLLGDRWRLSDIDGLTAAVSARASTDNSAWTARATAVITSLARKPTIAPPRIFPVSGSVRSLISPSVSDSMTARGLANQMLGNRNWSPIDAGLALG